MAKHKISVLKLLGYSKKMQRQTMLKMRNSISEDYQKYCSQKIAQFIFALKVYQDAKCIALYQAVKREISLEAVFQQAKNTGKTCTFPILQPEKTLKFGIASDKTIFKKNRFGILEPETTNLYTPYIDLYFLPLVAFDIYGNRLGMGAGYYDKTLAAIKKPFCIGIGYAVQQLTSVAIDSTDHRLDLIITEHGTISPIAPLGSTQQ